MVDDAEDFEQIAIGVPCVSQHRRVIVDHVARPHGHRHAEGHPTFVAPKTFRSRRSAASKISFVFPPTVAGSTIRIVVIGTLPGSHRMVDPTIALTGMIIPPGELE